MLQRLLYKSPFHILCIIVLGIAAYSNTFKVPFQFDDNAGIVKNPVIQYFGTDTGLSHEEISEITINFKNRFIGYFTFALNYRLHGLEVSGFHVVNITVHIINALLVYWLILLTLKTPFFHTTRQQRELAMSSGLLISFFSALLFISHPVQTQAVTYIIQRLTSLATMFYLLSLIMYIKARLSVQKKVNSTKPSGKKGITKTVSFYGVSLISAVLAMRTKEIAFTLPVVLALYEFLFFKGKFSRRVVYLIPLFLTILIIPFSLIGIDKPIGDIISDVSEASRLQTAMSRFDYLLTEARVVVTYIRLLLFPVKQNLDYDYPIYHSFYNPQVFAAFLSLFFIACSGIYLCFRSQTKNPLFRLTAFGVFWFFITLSVESSFIPIVDVIFEHRLYLPSTGFFIVLSTAVFYASRAFAERWRWGDRILVTLCTLIVLALAGSTYARNMVWADEISLWSDVVIKSPQKARGYNNLGFAYKNRGVTREAIQYYQRALKLQPDYAVAHNNVADAYNALGSFESAIEHGRIAIALKPDYVDAYNTLALGYYYTGWYEKAIEHFQNALLLNPFYAEAYSNLGVAYATAGSLDEAVKNFKAALRLNQSLSGVHYNLGIIYKNQGMPEKAEEHFRMAERLKKQG
jgi:tetratricopeptide (TPR) repeat protein